MRLAPNFRGTRKILIHDLCEKKNLNFLKVSHCAAASAAVCFFIPERCREMKFPMFCHAVHRLERTKLCLDFLSYSK